MVYFSMNDAKRLLISLILISSAILLICSVASAESKNKVILYFFWGDGCPHCAKQKEFLSVIKKKYTKLDIKDYEVWSNPASRELLLTMSKSYGITPSGVPVTFIGDKGFVGFNEEIGKEIEKTIKACLKKICEDPLFYKKY